MAAATRHVEELQAALSDTRLGEFRGLSAAMLAHEVNNLLVPALFHVEQAQLVVNQNRIDKHLAQIEISLEGIARLVQNRSIEAPAANDNSASLAAIIDTVVQGFRHKFAQSGGLRIRVSDDAAVSEVVIGVTALQQILSNLLLNAAAASPPDAGGVEVLIHRISTLALGQWWAQGPMGCSAWSRVAQTCDKHSPQESIVIEVCDKGRGFPQFPANPVFSLGSQSSRDERSGLGLLICQRLVEEVGGAIAIWSKPNVGTVVGVVLPLAPSAAAVTLSKPTAQRTAA